MLVGTRVQFCANVDLSHLDPLHHDAFVDEMFQHAKELVTHYGGRTECYGAQEGMEIVLS